MRGARGRWSFTAVLAPLGVPTVDGRVLSPRGQFTLSPYFTFLATPTPTRGGFAHEGIVRELTVVDGCLTAAGVVWSGDIAADMAAGTVWPEMSLIDVRSDRNPATNNLIFARGTVGAVIAGHSPAWPGIRFSLEEA